MSKDKWIGKATAKHKGALRKELGVKKGEDIPAGKLKKAEHSKNKKEAERARLAAELKGFRKK